MASNRTAREIAALIQQFVDGTIAEWDWDAFLSTPLADPALDEIRKKCSGLPDHYPPVVQGWYCDEEGLDFLRDLIRELSGPAA